MEVEPSKQATVEELIKYWAKTEKKEEEASMALMGIFDTFVSDEAERYFVNGDKDERLETFAEFARENRKDHTYFSIFTAYGCRWSLPKKDRYTNLPNASQYGKGMFKDTQQVGHKLEILCGRPAECSWINIRIMHPVFHTVIEAMRDGQTPEPHDYDFAQELCAVMSEVYPLESERRENVNRLLMQRLFREKKISLLSTIGFNVEFKNERGESGDPYLRNLACYTGFSKDPSDDGTGSTPHHCFPFLLLEILGPEMGLAGAARACGYACGQPLTPNIAFIHGDSDATLFQARLCRALRLGIDELHAWYTKVAKTLTTQEAKSQAQFPYPRQANFGDEKNVDFVYIRPFKPDERKMVFVAKRRDGTGDEFLVKFTEWYGKEVHEMLAEKKRAPALHDVRDCYGWKMVVMELLKDVRMWHPDVDARDGNLVDQVWEIAELLQKGDFVHGDLRDPNVLVDENSKQVYLVDFDWAGKMGDAKYPRKVNPNANFPDGITTGVPITFEIDKKMLNDLTKNSRQRVENMEGQQDDYD